MRTENRFIFFIIGVMLVVLSLSTILYDRYMIVKEEVFVEIDKKKISEGKDRHNQEVAFEEDDNNEIIVDTDNVDDYVNQNTKTNLPAKKYIAYLKIEKISLNVGLVAKNSYYNNVNRNVLTIKQSTYPDTDKGNLILAAHSGNSNISYFRYLYKLKVGDKATVNYNEHNYDYRLVNIYQVPKDGTVAINRSKDKTCLTLITCTKNSDTQQSVYIFELYAKDGEVYE